MKLYQLKSATFDLFAEEVYFGRNDDELPDSVFSLGLIKDSSKAHYISDDNLELAKRYCSDWGYQLVDADLSGHPCRVQLTKLDGSEPSYFLRFIPSIQNKLAHCQHHLTINKNASAIFPRSVAVEVVTKLKSHQDFNPDRHAFIILPIPIPIPEKKMTDDEQYIYCAGDDSYVRTYSKGTIVFTKEQRDAGTWPREQAKQLCTKLIKDFYRPKLTCIPVKNKAKVELPKLINPSNRNFWTVVSLSNRLPIGNVLRTKDGRCIPINGSGIDGLFFTDIEQAHALWTSFDSDVRSHYRVEAICVADKDVAALIEQVQLLTKQLNKNTGDEDVKEQGLLF